MKRTDGRTYGQMMHAVFETAPFKMHSLPLSSSPFIAFLPSCSRFSPGGWILMIWPRWRDAGWKAGGRAARSIRAIIPFAFATCQCRRPRPAQSACSKPAGARAICKASMGHGSGRNKLSVALRLILPSWASVLSCLSCDFVLSCYLPQVSPP